MQIQRRVLLASLSLLALLSITILPVVATDPVAAFSGSPTSGTLPLTVSFTDSSTNTPTGWSWFFGDENFTAPWTIVNGSAGWSKRYGHSSVVMPDGSIVLMGGYDGSTAYHDVWRSIDNGTTWMSVNISGNPGWSARYGHRSVVIPDGSIVLMGGLAGSTQKNDVWRSTDNGATWMLMNASAEWSGRSGHTSVAMPDGSIVLMGGYVTTQMNDTWRSTDNGATWMLMNASSGWTVRSDHSSVALPDGSIVLMGGSGNNNNVWRSTDNGAHWTQMTASAEWPKRYAHMSVAMPDGSIVLMGGYDSSAYNDVWRSTDNGAHWTQVNASAGWSARSHFSSVVLRDGTIEVMGGFPSPYFNDVWWFNPIGSSEQNPSHTYPTTGKYNVTLQVYNFGRYNSTRKIEYITVTELPPPIASFTSNVTSGTAPLVVQFNDTSTNSPTAWNWSFRDVAGNNTQVWWSTARNTTQTFGVGNFSIAVNASNSAGYNISTQATFINVSTANTLPIVSNVVLTSTSGFNRTSDNLTLTWAVSDPDGNPIRNITNWYRNGTSITVLNMPFEGGSNSTFTKDYSGYGNSGTDHGAVWNATGGHDGGGAYDISGTQYLSISDSPSLDINGTGLTLETWVYPRTLTNYMAIVGKEASSNAEPYWVYQLEGFSGGISFRLSTNGNARTWADSSPLSTNRWYHVVGTYDGTAMRLYINGELNNSVTKSGNVTTSTGKFSIGRFQNANTNNFNGIVDGVRVYDRALSAEQIRALYLNSTDLLVSQELIAGDTWQGSITPNDGISDGNAEYSNLLNITSSVPVASFTSTPASGTAPLTVQFNDTSTNTPTTWNWSFKNVTGNNTQVWWSTVRNATQTFGVGNFSIALNTSNSAGYNISSQVTFINVTAANNLPVASNVLLSSTSGFNRTADNLTLSWTASDPDGNPVWNITNWYRNATSMTVLNMPFEGGSNETWTKDYSGLGHDGTVHSMSWNATGGPDGSGAYNFSGTTDIDTGTFNPSDPAHITMTAWVYPQSGSVNSNKYIITKGSDASDNSYGISLWGSTTTNIIARVMVFKGSLYMASTPAGNISYNTWHHVAGTINGSILNIYLDGELQGTYTLPFSTISNTSQNVYIGGQNRGGYNYRFKGYIDDIAMYDRVLSPEQIRVIYLNRTDLIVSQELKAGDRWQGAVTPNDGISDGVTVMSNLLNVTASPPGASFTTNVTSGTAPLAVQFYDTSTGSPNAWNWSFGDGTYSASQNVTHAYATTGAYTVNLTATNTGGSNTTSQTRYMLVDVASVVTGRSNREMTGVYNDGGIAPTGKLKWSYPLAGGDTYWGVGTNPTVWNGTVYAESFDGKLYAINTRTGTLNWVYTTGTGFRNSANPINGPTVADGVVYFGDCASNVYAVNAINGTLIWKSPVLSENVWRPVIPGYGFVYAIDNTYHFYALNAATGEIVWTSTTSLNAKVPLVTNGTVVLVQPGDVGFVSLNASTGAQNFIFTTSNAGERGGIAVERDIIYASNFDWGWAFFSTNGTQIWTNKATGFPAANGFAIANGLIYKQSESVYNSYLWAWNMSTVSQMWKTPAYSTWVGFAPAIANGTAYLSISQGTPGSAGPFYIMAINATTGDALWTVNTPQYLMGSPAVSDGMLFVMGRDNLYAYGGPWANFTANTTSGTAPLTVQFTDISLGSPTSWNWSFGDIGAGNFSTNKNPTHTYNSAGSFNVTLNATGTLGSDIKTVTYYINVSAATVAPVASFTANKTSGTAPLAVQFNDTSTNTPTAWNWSFKNVAGNNTQVWWSSARNATQTFGAGNFSIAVNASNSAGYSISTQVTFINVTATGLAPVANLNGTPTSGTAPLTVKFMDDSTNNPTIWNWSFGDASLVNSTVQDPIHTYTSAGTYTVSLNATNSAGSNTSTRTNYITVTPGVAAPVANFAGTPTSGTAPLSVSFTDSSLNLPTGWAWFFGDENFTAPWTLKTASAGWTARMAHSSVVLPDGSIIVMGGSNGGSNRMNDTWRSTNNGATWTLMNASSGWTARMGHASIATPDGSIVLMGGDSGSGLKNDVWRSIDKGATWIKVNSSPGWGPRVDHKAVVMADGSIVLMGGNTGGGGFANNVWRSTDNGATWTQVITSGPMWSAREGHATVVMPDGSIVLMGGYNGINFLNDVWGSSDNGATWSQAPSPAAWSPREDYPAVTMPDGSIIVMGGSNISGFKNDMFRSKDKGFSWGRPNTSVEWGPRVGHTSVAMPDGSIVLMGGNSDTGAMNDTWRFNPVGSTIQNPSHIYTTQGTYKVALQAYNTAGYNSTRKSEYITVSADPNAPKVSFTSNVTSGVVPLTVAFNDTSTGSPVSWEWSFGDNTSSTEQNPVHTFQKPQVNNVRLKVANSDGLTNQTMHQIVVYGVKSDTNMVLNGTTATIINGKQNLAVNASTLQNTGGNITTTNTILTMTGGNSFWTKTRFFADNVALNTTTGDYTITNTTQVVMQSAPVSASLNKTIGDVSVSLDIALKQYVPNAVANITITEGATTDTTNAFQLAAQDSSINIKAIAYTIQFSNTDAINANLTQNATRQSQAAILSMNINHTWVAQFATSTNNDGRDSIVIIRYPDTGSPKVLTTRFNSYNSSSNLDAFEADSPAGLSIFGMIGYSAQQASSSQSSSSSGVGSSGGGSSGSSGAGKTDSKAAAKEGVSPQKAPHSSSQFFQETATLNPDKSGLLPAEVQVQSIDQVALLTLPQGIQATDNTGQPLTEVSILPLDSTAVPPPDSRSPHPHKFTGLAYHLGPDGSHFSPSIDLTLTLTPDQWNNLHKNGWEPVVHVYSTSTNGWQELTTNTETTAHIISTPVPHFSDFAVFAQPARNGNASAVTPAQNATAGNASKSPANAFEIMAGLGLWGSGLIINNPLMAVIGIIVIGIGYAGWVQYRKKKERDFIMYGRRK